MVTFLPHKKLAHYGQGFYLWIYEDGRKYWRLRYKIHLTTGRINKQKAKQAAGDSFEAIAREWYSKQTHTWVRSHTKDVIRRLEMNVFPYIGMYPIARLKPRSYSTWYASLNIVVLMIWRIECLGYVVKYPIRYGVSTGRCNRDPAVGLRGALTPHKKKNQAAVKPEEMPELLRAMATYESIGDRQTQLALQFAGFNLCTYQWTHWRTMGRV